MKKLSLIFALLIAFAVSPAVFSQKGADIPVKENVKSETPVQEQAKERSAEELNSEQKPDSSGNLFATFRQGGPIMIIILIAGLIAMTIMIERIIFFTKNRIWLGDTLGELMKIEAEKSGAKYREELEDDLRDSFREYADGLERGLGLLAGMGNIAPILGFLGTVTGMISAFSAIAAATTVNAKVVAVGIQEALVTTAGGLMVAAPTLIGYYIFMHIIQNRYSESEVIIHSLTEKLPRMSDKFEDK